MTSTSSSALPDINVLSQIIGIARDLQDKSAKWLTNRGHRIESGNIFPSQGIHEARLPHVGGITPQLVASGVSSEAWQRISKHYHHHTTDLGRRTHENIDPAWTELSRSSIPPHLRQKATDAHTKFYERQLEQWACDAVARVRSLSPSASKNTDKSRRGSRRRFNYEYLPYLEQYFKENAFPSHGDKAEMARKAMMDYRQVDVWFQNRRSRAKKEGRSLKRLLMHEEPKESFEELENRMRHRIIPQNERLDPVDPDISEYEWQYDSDSDDSSAFSHKSPRSSDTLNKPSPPHAFPSVYPPSCDYDPFPPRDGKGIFPPPVWIRHPAKSIERRPTMDLDEFITGFARLNVRGGPRKRLVKRKAEDTLTAAKPKRTQSPPPKTDRSAATLAITTKPLQAPLPALIRSAVPVPSVDSSLRPSNLTFASRTSNPHWPDEIAPEKAAKRRKIAHLPRRSPASAASIRQGIIPSTSNICLPSSPSSLSSSRMSSFSSDCSSRTSSSSCSSSASSVIATPECSPSILPDLSAPLPVSESYALQGLGDPLENYLSPIESFRFGFSSNVDFPAAADKGIINTPSVFPSTTLVCGQ